MTRSGGNTRDRYHRNTWRVTKRVLPVTSLLEALLHLTGAAVEHNQAAAQRPGGDVSAVRTAMGMRLRSEWRRHVEREKARHRRWCVQQSRDGRAKSRR